MQIRMSKPANGVLLQFIENLSPMYFALVMATGILSIACKLLNLETAGILLFWLNNVQYGLLVLLFAYRLVAYPKRFLADLRSNGKGAGYLTMVAGSSILGVQHVLLGYSTSFAVALWFFALLTWLLLSYSFLLVMITNREKPTLELVVSGGWLLLVVSTQSLCILGDTLMQHLFANVALLIFFNLCLFSLGVILYIMLAAIIVLRLIAAKVKPQEFTPPYWVLMGAAAISTLSGAILIEKMNSSRQLTDLTPFVKGLSVFMWSVASWWIPLLIMLEIWRHVINRVSVTYDVAFWDTAFTLGMFTVATYRLSDMLDLAFLKALPEAGVYIAAGFWVLTFVGMVLNMIKAFRRS
jgi:tellurite resistance protein TehA-like permease